MHLRRTLAVATAVALALAACNGDDGAEDPVTEDITGQSSEDEPDDPPEDEPDEVDDPTEPEDPTEPDEDPTDDDGSDEDEGDDGNDPEDFAVPDEIDEEYVQRVMDELMRRDSDLVRGLLERETPSTLEDAERDELYALYDGPLRLAMSDAAVGYLLSEDGRSGQVDAESFGERRFEVMHLYRTEDDCITTFGWWDLTETAVDPFNEETHLAWVLHRNPASDDDFNPTGWQLWDNSILLSGGEPIPPEDWEDLDVGDSLDVECSGVGE